MDKRFRPEDNPLNEVEVELPPKGWTDEIMRTIIYGDEQPKRGHNNRQL
jgi:hypothetical protein